MLRPFLSHTPDNLLILPKFTFSLSLSLSLSYTLPHKGTQSCATLSKIVPEPQNRLTSPQMVVVVVGGTVVVVGAAVVVVVVVVVVEELDVGESEGT